MKASKGFLFLDLTVVVFLVSSLLLFVNTAFNGCVKNLVYMQTMNEAQVLAEELLLDETIDVPAHLQVEILEREVHGKFIKEVRVNETASGKAVYNLLFVK